MYMKCSCKNGRQHGYDCPHVFAISDEVPNPCDIAIQWHKVYYAVYLNGDPEMDNLFDDVVENEAPGLALPCDSVEFF
jgi:hypothetical protein